MKEIKKQNLITAAVIFIILTAFIIIAYSVAPFLFDNDNIYFKTVSSGEMTGKPEPHMYYIDIVFGLIVTALYDVTGNFIPWFGLLLVSCMGLVLFFVTFSVSCRYSKAAGKILVLLVSLLLTITFFYRYFAEIQYTIVAGLLGAGAVFALLTVDPDKTLKENLTSLIFFGLFSILSYSVRNNAFIMCFPFLGMAFISKFLDASQKKNRVIAVSALILISSLALQFGLHKIAYNSNEWQEFKRYNDASTVIVDYYGWPDYDTHKETYEAKGVLKSSYIAATGHYNLILDPHINADFFEDISAISLKEQKDSQGSAFQAFIDTAKKIIHRNLFDYEDRPLNVLVYFLYLFVLISAIAGKNIKALKDLLFLIIARTFVWFYLVYQGRYPFRVTQIIYFCELFWLIYILVYRKLTDFKNKRVSMTISLLLIIMISAVSLRFGLPISKQVINKTRGFDSLSDSFRELEQYFEEHSENFYFFDMSNLHYRERALEFRKRPYENYVYMGGWLSSSPWYKNKLKERGISAEPAKDLMDRKDLYIVYQVTEGYSRDFLDDFFSEHYPGSYIEKADELVSSNGFVYEILKVNRH